MVGAYKVDVVVGVGACVGTDVMVRACRIEVVVGGSADVGIGSVLRCGIGKAAAYAQLSDSEWLRREPPGSHAIDCSLKKGRASFTKQAVGPSMEILCSVWENVEAV
jgi:hypothetical protein